MPKFKVTLAKEMIVYYQVTVEAADQHSAITKAKIMLGDGKIEPLPPSDIDSPEVWVDGWEQVSSDGDD